MNLKTHILGFPKIGFNRELKFAVEKYWRTFNSSDEIFLEGVKEDILRKNWLLQIENNLDYITVGDFTYYDQVLNTLVYLNCIPKRFEFKSNISLKEYFELARGNKDQNPMEMTKWFNTNYHYLIPEYDINSSFSYNLNWLLKDINFAKTFNYPIKLVLIGPLTLLKLGKIKDIKLKNRLFLLPKLLSAYINLIYKINLLGIKVIQIDEPILILNLSNIWIEAFKSSYNLLTSYFSNILLTTYFSEIKNFFNIINNIPFLGLHIDIINNNQYNFLLNNYNKDKIISLGIIDGRNIWKNNLERSFYIINNIKKYFDNIWLSTSCSLIHSPLDIKLEKNFDYNIRNWISFSKQKIEELNILKNLFFNYKNKFLEIEFIKNIFYIENRKKSNIVYNNKIQNIIKNLNNLNFSYRNNYLIRNIKQKILLKLSNLTTTTIGSFPQTNNIRNIRFKFNKNIISYDLYINNIKKEINFIIKKQIYYNIDVLVHGEPERNDMVEYFANYLDGYIITNFGWIQSYGTRCVKSPIIYGDIYMKKSITLDWIKYAQSLTEKFVKGMLTGPITMLKWSFYRNDQPNYVTSLQISISILKEVLNLEKFNIRIIQIDEPAIREFLPLKKENYFTYFNWAKKIFLLSFNKVNDKTQIHTHICYSEFENILDFISSLDVDVISIETSRSNMEILPYLLNYSNEIGLGIYDIHNENILNIKKSLYFIKLITNYINIEKIWINPDCGLKTRNWNEINESLINMVKSTKLIKNFLKI